MKILSALDDSDYALKALRKAVDMAKKESAELIIDAAYLDGLSLEFREVLAKQAEDIVVQGKAIAEKENVIVKTVIESGYSPADNIVRYAEQNNIDLIVIGHKSRSGLVRLLVGSVAVKVVAYAPCSVLVMR